MIPARRRLWKTRGVRPQRQAAAPDAGVQWSVALFPGEPKRIWPSSADGNWRDKVIESSFIELEQAEPGDPEIEPEAEL